MEDDPLQVYVPYVEPQKMSFWRKLGGGSLTISILVHAIILAIGVVIVVQQLPNKKEEEPDFTAAPGGGGGSPDATDNARKVRVTAQNNASRLSAKGASSAFTLPEPDPSSDMTSLSALDGGSLASKGLGGKGKGGGKGNGDGTGIGDGTGPGSGIGAGLANPFGMAANSRDPGLIGTFYDLKQTKSKTPTGISEGQVHDLLKNFITKGWNARTLDSYYKAPQKLKQTRIMMPNMEATEAPAAFNCAAEVQPSKWVVIYRGAVTAPKSGKYRFVGAADDVMAIRFNNQTVLDYGYFVPSIGKYSGEIRRMNEEQTREAKRTLPMPIPLQLRPYPGIERFNPELGGLAVGKDFTVTAGTSYPIEILISEIPGGRFGGFLLIEQEGISYPQTPNGLPLIPLFRTDTSFPEKDVERMPPWNPQSPAWITRTTLSSSI